MTPGDGGSRNECWGTNIWVMARPLQPWAAPCLVVVSRSVSVPGLSRTSAPVSLMGTDLPSCPLSLALL